MGRIFLGLEPAQKMGKRQITCAWGAGHLAPLHERDARAHIEAIGIGGQSPVLPSLTTVHAVRIRRFGGLSYV